MSHFLASQYQRCAPVCVPLMYLQFSPQIQSLALDGGKYPLLLLRHGANICPIVRHRTHDGVAVADDVSKSDFDRDEYLKPVLEDDAVIMGLFDLPDVVPEKAAPGEGAATVDDLLKRNVELQEELARVTAQFESYRVTVAETLDQRWGDVDAAEAEAKAAADEKAKGKAPEDSSKYYWESYAGNGT